MADDEDRLTQLLRERAKLYHRVQAAHRWRQWRSILFHTYQLPTSLEKRKLVEAQVEAARAEIAALDRGIENLRVKEFNARQSGMTWSDQLLHNLSHLVVSAKREPLLRRAHNLTQSGVLIGVTTERSDPASPSDPT